MLDWIKAAAIRSVRTAAQAALGIIGASALLGGVNWLLLCSAALFAAITSMLTSLAGLPETNKGENVFAIKKRESMNTKRQNPVKPPAPEQGPPKNEQQKVNINIENCHRCQYRSDNWCKVWNANCDIVQKKARGVCAEKNNLLADVNELRVAEGKAPINNWREDKRYRSVLSSEYPLKISETMKG